MQPAEVFDLDDVQLARAVFGHRDENLRTIEHELTVNVHVRGSRVSVSGDPEDAATARRTIFELSDLVREGFAPSGPDVRRAVQILRESPDTALRSIFMDAIVVGAGNRSISPKTVTQKAYVELIRACDIAFGIGPAGTGKTYLAMAVGVSMLLQRRVKRIVLTRPAVEAGEKLGFLPGDLQEKVSPYLRPLHDALHDMLDFDRAAQWIEKGVIEVAPIAFMRGRTLNASYVILDEAQNCTREQMKMFLTRLGYDSRAVITGDLTQTDLPPRSESGLAHAASILDGVEGIGFCRFTEVDVVRHPLVRRIIAAYEANERAREEMP